MPFGYYGKVLHINLTDNNWYIEEPTEKWYRSYVTPPLGVDLFIASAITRVSIKDIVKHVWPFILILIFVLLLISYYPPLSTFLVNTFGG